MPAFHSPEMVGNNVQLFTHITSCGVFCNFFNITIKIISRLQNSLHDVVYQN